MSETNIRVWAPDGDEVDVVVGGEALEMQRADGGWWQWDRGSRGEVTYSFRIDEGDDLPDPRSPWLPRGVHGPSRAFDIDELRWTDADWPGPRDGRGVLGGVIYELHVGTFTDVGTLDAAIHHLDHLVDLGVDVVEVMPLAPFDGDHGWGYDGVQPYAVHEPYGGPAAFQRFVDACHARGLGVCLDVVYNHLGPTGNYLARFGPYFTERHTTPWGAALNFDDEGAHEVRRWVIDNALRWFREFHVDALRLDAVHALHDDSERHLLTELADEVAALSGELGRPLELIAESDLNDSAMVRPTPEGGRGMTAQWADDVHHALHVALTGEQQGYYADFAGGGEAWPDGGPLSVLGKTLTEVFLHDGRRSTFRDSVWGAPVDRDTVDGHRFVVYLQNHDQVGNRATGDRISSAITPGQQAIGASLYLLSPYTPMLFMGEEWRARTPFQFFTSFEDDDLAEAVRTGRREEFTTHGWSESEVPDPQDPGTRERSVLRWEEVAEPDHAAMRAFYRRLIAIRRTEPDVATGDLRSVGVAFDDGARWFVMSRGTVHVVANLSERDQVVPFEADAREVIESWGGNVRHREGGFWLPGHDVAIVRTA